MPRIPRFASILAIVMVAPLLAADDITGATKLLCTSVQATSCNDDGDCESDLPWNFNVPQFIEIDLTAKRLNTTRASDENRESPIGSVIRADGLLVIQGLEQGRAYSFVINEKSGRLAAAVARDGVTVTVFGACTPLAAR
jgi:hypothetical protein